MSRFSFLEETLKERRSYDYSAGHAEMIEDEMARLAAAYPKEPLPKIEKGPIGNWKQPSFSVNSHRPVQDQAAPEKGKRK